MATCTRQNFKFTEAMLDRAEQLRALPAPIPWKSIAERFGCDAASLKARVCERRHGKRKGGHDRLVRERLEIERRLLAGAKVAEIARERQVTRAAINARLRSVGLDKSMRKELLAERWR